MGAVKKAKKEATATADTAAVTPAAKKAAAAAKGSGPVGSVGARLTLTKTADSEGIIVAKLSEQALKAAVKNLGLDVAAGAPLAEMAMAVFGNQKAGEEKKDFECILCNVCGGESDENLDSCPYCGDGDEAKPADGEAVEPKEDDEEGHDSVPPPAALAAVPPTTLAGAPSKAVPGGKKPPSVASLAVVQGGKLGTYKEKDLDHAVKEVIKYKGSAGAAYWDLGHSIAEIYEKDLWKLRTSEEKPQGVYRTFEAFCNAELQMQPMSALSAKDIAQRYTRDVAEKFGRSKMTFLVRADDLDRPALEQLVKSGASKAQVAKRAKELKAGKPVVERTGKVRKPPEATRPAKKDTITAIALLEASQTIPLWKKPAGKLEKTLLDTRALTRAKKLGDEPVGRLELPNGVCLYVTVDATPGGELRAKVKFVREDTPADG